MRRIFLGVGLAGAIGAASVAFPQAMLSPGTVIAGHGDIEVDCFACHVPFGGPDGRCLACHEIEEIGADGGRLPRFHFALLERECSACHTDHLGREAARALREFRHALLRNDLREQCASCHKPPEDELHGGVDRECSACHEADSWTPATFDHAQLFRFDRDHPADCKSCHPTGFSTFSCYGCHEHRPAEVEKEHREEGIVDIANCVRCHRSGEKDEAEHGGEREDRRRRRGRERDDDD